MKLLHVIGIMICLSILVVMPVYASDYSGNFTGDYPFVQSTETIATSGIHNQYMPRLRFQNIENYPGLKYVFDEAAWVSAGGIDSDSCPVLLWAGTTQIGTGTFGYNHNYATGKVNLFLNIETWNIGGRTGIGIINMTAPSEPTWDTGFNTLTSDIISASGDHTVAFTFSGAVQPYFTGAYIITSQPEFYNEWTATKTGLNVRFVLIKHDVGGINYPSKGYLVSAQGYIINQQGAVDTTSWDVSTTTTPVRLAVVDALGTWFNTSLLYTGTGVYSIKLGVSSMPLTSSTTGLLESSSDPTLVGITDIDWYWGDGTGTYDFVEGGNVSRPLSYTKVGATWWGYEVGVGGIGGVYSRNKGTAIPNPVSISNISSSGSKVVTCFVGTSTGEWYELTETLTIEQGGMQTLIVEATDASSNALVSYTDIAVLDKSSNLWSNVTASGGVYNYLFPYNANLYIEGTAGGYNKATKNWTVLPYPSYILKLQMYPTGTVAATNVSLNVVILDGSTSGVFPNVQVRLSDGQVKSTSGAGVANFNVSATKSYQITASYTGYQSATRTLTTGSGGTSQDTYLTLNRIVVTTAPTLPPGVTAVVTLDTRTNAQKDQGMMDQIRNYADLLIPVACLMTLLYMFGYKA